MIDGLLIVNRRLCQELKAEPYGIGRRILDHQITGTYHLYPSGTAVGHLHGIVWPGPLGRKGSIDDKNAELRAYSFVYYSKRGSFESGVKYGYAIGIERCDLMVKLIRYAPKLS